jgi:hypothetical protein
MIGGAEARAMFITKLTGSNGVLDKKLFSSVADAKRYVTGEGLKAFEGDVIAAEIFSAEGFSAEGKLIWWKTHPKTEEKRKEAFNASWSDGTRVFLDGSYTESRPYRKRGLFKKRQP